MYELNKAKFGAFVAQLRKEQELTQKALAAQLMISDKAVSKWETGTTIPDTGLLIPLAELLGVTVTELLYGQHMESQPMPPEQVETIVKTAINYTEAAPTRAWQEQGRWGVAYVLAILVTGILLLLLWKTALLSEAILTTAVLTCLFSGYFCFFVRMKLPDYYDQHKLSGVQDGILRLNVPGLHFNNKNWPHIVNTARFVLLTLMTALPLLALILGKLLPQLWTASELAVVLIALLGGLFVPLYVVGRKYE